MREALNQAKARFEDLTRQLEDPAIHSNPGEMKRVSKERSGLEPLVRAARRYDDVLFRLEEDRAFLRSEKDAELSALAKAEI